jgi:hypothetical protein
LLLNIGITILQATKLCVKATELNAKKYNILLHLIHIIGIGVAGTVGKVVEMLQKCSNHPGVLSTWKGRLLKFRFQFIFILLQIDIKTCDIVRRELGLIPPFSSSKLNQTSIKMLMMWTVRQISANGLCWLCIDTPEEAAGGFSKEIRCP